MVAAGLAPVRSTVRATVPTASLTALAAVLMAQLDWLSSSTVMVAVAVVTEPALGVMDRDRVSLDSRSLSCVAATLTVLLVSPEAKVRVWAAKLVSAALTVPPAALSTTVAAAVAPVRVTVKVPEAPSATPAAGPAMAQLDCSSSRMVRLALAVPTLPEAGEMVAVTTPLASATVSPVTLTLTCLLASPAAKVTVWVALV